jgi:hypothetical protein
MKKKFMNIRPQEVTENGERSLQYKGSDGKMHGIAPAGNGGDTAQSNIVFDVIFENNEQFYTEEFVKSLVEAGLAGKSIVCVADNIWGVANEHRIGYVVRIKGFQIVDGETVLANEVELKLAPSSFGDLELISFTKQQDGSYQVWYNFNK